MTPIPIIDVSGLPGDTAAVGPTVAAIGAACRDVGFFYVTGHSVPPGLSAAAFAEAKLFFSQPEATKRKVLYSAAGNRGYVPMKGEALNPRQPADLKEAFNIGLELPADDPELLVARNFRAANLWPDLPGFRNTMLAYFEACKGLGLLLHRAFAQDLGLPPAFFEDKLDRPMAVLRLLHYPAATERAEAGQLGAGEHTDYGCVTLLATDGVGGLEVRTRSGEMAGGTACPGYVRVQHRRLPDALDE